MRRISPVLTVLLAVAPLMGAVPASRVKEPNAVFAYAVDGGRVTATLFDRLAGKQIDYLDARTDLPISAAKSSGGNDTMQFSAATKKIYAMVNNVSGYDGSTVDETLPYDVAIVETDFDFSEPKTVFSCDACSTEQWIVHPSKPLLYVGVPDVYDHGADEFRNAKLVEVTLLPKLRTRVIARIPANAALRMTPDGDALFVFGQAAGSRDPYGALVKITLSDRHRVQTVVNLPPSNSFGGGISAMSDDASPDAREMAYHMGVIDVRTRKTEAIMADTPHEIDNVSIGWSRDAKRILFQMMDKSGDERVEVPIVYDRAKKLEWILPIQDANLLDWSPAQTAILFLKRGDVGYYDLTARAWVFVAKASEGSWVTLPTKRVPKR